MRRGNSFVVLAPLISSMHSRSLERSQFSILQLIKPVIDGGVLSRPPSDDKVTRAPATSDLLRAPSSARRLTLLLLNQRIHTHARTQSESKDSRQETNSIKAEG